MLEEWSRLGTPKQVEYLAGYLEAERDSRDASKRASLLRRCGLPAPKTFDGYDWSAASWPEGLGREDLLSLSFLDRREDLVLMGDVGTGKTHMASALCQLACDRRLEARFFTASSLVMRLRRAREEGRLDREMSQLSRARLLVIDELGFLPLDADGARLVFQVFADAYERQSVVITTNLEFSRWGSVFGDDQMAAAVIDRVVHHGRLVQFRGESYRVRHALMQEGQALKKPVHASCAGCSISDAHSAQKSLTKHMLRRSVLGGDRGARRGRRPELVPRRVRRRALERGGPRLRAQGVGEATPLPRRRLRGAGDGEKPEAPPAPVRPRAEAARSLDEGPGRARRAARGPGAGVGCPRQGAQRRGEAPTLRAEAGEGEAEASLTLAGQSGGRGAQDSAVIPRAPYGFRLHPRRPVAAREEGSRHGPLAHRRPPTSRPESPPFVLRQPGQIH